MGGGSSPVPDAHVSPRIKFRSSFEKSVHELKLTSTTCLRRYDQGNYVSDMTGAPSENKPILLLNIGGNELS